MKFSSNLVELMKTLEGISPEDARGYLRFLSDIYKRYQIAKVKKEQNYKRLS